jgi:CDP-diglyceride synthetase
MNSTNIKKEILIGFLVALIATSFGCFIFIEFLSNYGFYETIAMIREGNLEGKILVLGAIANFFVFFVFIKKKQLYRARGVLMETFFVAFLVLLLTLFSE